MGWVVLALGGLALAGCEQQAATGDPLPSWVEGENKQSIIQFVESVTTEGGAQFVPPAERIAVFDNDGTLWSEKPVYFQLQFALDRVRELAPENPEWQNKQPFRAVLENDLEALVESGSHGLLEILMATHAGMTTDEFADAVSRWGATATHPKTGMPYVEMVYQPMLELLEYLRANEFRTYIVSGGGIDFLRVWSEELYDVPPEQVVGSSIVTQLETRDGQPVLVRVPEIDFIDDKAGKPVGIHRHIGRRPIAAFGNSDGDLEMLQWVEAGAGPSLCLIVHHTDAEREWAYDRDSKVGQLNRALEEAATHGWTVVDMAADWNHVYPSAHGTE